MKLLTPSDFRAYQPPILDFIRERPRQGVALLMGGGKTVIGYTSAWEWIITGECSKVLIVSTKRNVLGTWPRQATEWSHLREMRVSVIAGDARQRTAAATAKADVHVISYDNIAWLTKCIPLNNWPWDGLILDESSLVSNHSSKRFQAIFSRETRYKRVSLLSGSPAAGGHQWLWSQQYLIDQGAALGRTFSQFEMRYMTKNPYTRTSEMNEGAEEIIREKIADSWLFVDPTSELDTIDAAVNQVRIDLDADSIDLYREIEQEFYLRIQDQDIVAANAAVLSNKLRQFCNGWMYDVDRKPVHLNNFKLDALEELVELSASPVLVAVDYIEDQERILKRFKGSRSLTRAGPEVERDWNKGKIPVLVANPKSAGHGLDLQHGGHVMIWYGMTWSADLFTQMNARLGPVRQAQSGYQRQVQYYWMAVSGSVEEKVMNRIITRGESLAGLLNHLRKEAYDGTTGVKKDVMQILGYK